ncbi:MAG: hypothetical protein AB1704_00985 [Pseudomonadota bacterium]|uniref:hypothetical protein n=1 Tax=Burkholderiaceae TaxID=119060 RepID=UPI0010F77A21|nr:hypothetical protein [Burkholderia sp. 4M9327F10]
MNEVVIRENPALLFTDSTTLKDPSISREKETAEGVLAKGGTVHAVMETHIETRRTTFRDFNFDLIIFSLMTKGA